MYCILTLKEQICPSPISQKVDESQLPYHHSAGTRGAMLSLQQSWKSFEGFGRADILFYSAKAKGILFRAEIDCFSLPCISHSRFSTFPNLANFHTAIEQREFS